MDSADGLQRARIYAKARWVTPPGQWWGNAEITIQNLENQPVTDPEISFKVAADQRVHNGYGLIWQRSGNTVTGRFVAERKTILAGGGTQSFTIGLDRSVAVVGELPFGFMVNGESADPPVDHEPPSKPGNLHLVSAGPFSLSLAWEPSTDNIGIDHYAVMIGVTPPEEPVTITVKSNSATVSGLKPETTYSAVVEAFDISGNGSTLSDPIQAKTTAPLPDTGDWDLPRAPFIDYTSWPTPKIDPIGAATGLDGAFLGFLTCPPVPEKPEDQKYWWAGLTKGMYDGTNDTAYPGDATVSDYQKVDLMAFSKRGGHVVFSFGGAANVPLEAVETDVAKIAAAYDGIIDNYAISHLDFDFEGAFIHDYAGQDRHIAAITRVIQGHPGIKVSYTLPVDGAPGSLVGFNDGGIRLLKHLAAGGIEPNLVNGMLMEFGHTSPSNLFDASVVALEGMHAAIAAIWPHWSDDKVWRRIGACPMFGVNNNGKTFYVADMEKLAAWCAAHNVGCLSGWDISRDNQAMSGVVQEPYDFTKIIAGYSGPTKQMPVVVLNADGTHDQVGTAYIADDGTRHITIATSSPEGN